MFSGVTAFPIEWELQIADSGFRNAGGTIYFHNGSKMPIRVCKKQIQNIRLSHMEVIGWDLRTW